MIVGCPECCKAVVTTTITTATAVMAVGSLELLIQLRSLSSVPAPPHPQSPSPSDETAQPLENDLGNVRFFNCVLVLSHKSTLPSEKEEDHLDEDPSWIQWRDLNVRNSQIKGPVTDGVMEYEHILKQKTFTRSERDRLTALLHSRTMNKFGISGKRGVKVTKTTRQDGFDRTAHENGLKPSEVPRTNLSVARSNV